MIKDLKNNKIGDWSIDTFTVSEKEAEAYNLRCLIKNTTEHMILSGTYKRLKYKSNVYMSNTPMEKITQGEAVSKAHGNVLVAGLGIGLFLESVINKNKVKSVTVIEKSKEVIELVGPIFEKYNKIKIINSDIFHWKPENKYDFAWFDIWLNICSDNLKEMEKLKNKYNKTCKEMMFWSEDQINKYMKGK